MRLINFSIVIPLYNKEQSIKSTLLSVLSQSYSNYEVLIVNDGSTDSSLDIVKSFHDSRLKIFSKINGGVSSARNLGIREAKNNYVAFLDGDDLWAENHLETMAEMIRAFPNDVVYYTKFTTDESHVFTGEKIEIKKTDDYLSEFFSRNWIHTSAVCVSRDYLIDNNLFFNEKLAQGEDLDLWQRLTVDNGAVFCNKCTEIYRLNTENNTSKLFNIEKRYDYIIRKKDFENIKNGKKFYYYIISGSFLRSITNQHFKDIVISLRIHGLKNIIISLVMKFYFKFFH